MVRDFRDKGGVWLIRLYNCDISPLYKLSLEPGRNGIIVIAVNIGANSKHIQGFKEKFHSLNSYLQAKDITVFAVRGSDDNKALFNDRNWDVLSNIKLVEDYTILQLPNNNNTLVVGGDMTTHKDWRVKHGRYFKDEEPMFDHTLVKDEQELGFSINLIVLAFNISDLPNDPIVLFDNGGPTMDRRIDLICSAQKMLLQLSLKGHRIMGAFIPAFVTSVVEFGCAHYSWRPCMIETNINVTRQF